MPTCASCKEEPVINSFCPYSIENGSLGGLRVIPVLCQKAHSAYGTREGLNRLTSSRIDMCLLVTLFHVFLVVPLVTCFASFEFQFLFLSLYFVPVFPPECLSHDSLLFHGVWNMISCTLFGGSISVSPSVIC